ncbi:T9SS type A sorting domain-containing protein [Adhaeribacter pallidiroseus]|uniref:DNA helicase n=1 Tax=Adhaeribacter pallidiroseus TaxID=2072847 RepID=A0A369QMJ5_9BACT|nr:T9SS type A sorting domain-containing protein [Adhaeribacter pallidiroseus]RDC64885.1 DNA helicase [Adhaeribacter pallidiroseus]
MRTRFTSFTLFLPAWLFFKKWASLALFLALWLSLSFLAQAQTIEWQQTIGGSQEDQLTITQQTSDGGYILGGTSYSGKGGDKFENSRGNLDYWIVKLDSTGKKQWDRTFGGNDYDHLMALQQTSDGGYILGGSSRSNVSGDKSEKSQGEADYWIIKLNPNGQKMWDKTLGGNFTDLLVSVQQTHDGGYILGGSSYSAKSGDKSEGSKGSDDYWIVKLDAAGKKQWDKIIGGSDYDRLRALQQTPDGGYILGGTSGSNSSSDKSEDSRGGNDYWIVKLTAAGVKQWDQTFGGSSDDYLTALQQTQDEGYIVGGESRSDSSGDKSHGRKGNTSNSDYWILKLKADGTKDWDKTFGGSNSDALTSIQLTNDGGYILGGSSDSRIGGDKSEDRRGGADYWIVKLTGAGKKQWDQTLGGTGYDILTSVEQTQDGGYILGGYSGSGISGDKTGASRGNTDYWVVKLKAGSNKPQKITFAAIPPKTVYDKPFALQATASSGLPVIFRVISGPATIKGNLITLTGGGTVTIEASQPGNAEFRGAPEVIRSFLVDVDYTRLWDRTLGGSHADKLSAMIPTPDGGYLLGGTSNSSSTWDKSQSRQGGTDFWIVKLDSSGYKLWDKTYGGAANDNLQALVATPDGGFLLGGTSASGNTGAKSQPSRGKEDYWVVKIDSSGTQLWDKTYGTDQSDTFTALIITPDGGYLLGGYTGGGINGDKTEASRDTTGTPYVYNDFWVLKLDSQGAKQWDKTIGGKSVELLGGLINTPGGYLLAGKSSSNSSGDRTAPNYYTIDGGRSDVWVVKINEGGQILWDRAYAHGILYDNYQANIFATTDGNYLVGGYTYDDDFGVYSVFKITPAGEQLWSNAYGQGDYATNLPMSMVNTPDGGYLLANTNGDYSYSGSYWLQKVDKDGNKMYTKFFGNGKYNASENYLTALLATADGSYLLGGYSNSNQNAVKSETSKGDFDYWILKIKEADMPPVTDTSWNYRYGGSWHDKLTSTIRTFDGGYVAAGYSRSPKNGDKTQSRIGLEDYWLLKTDQQGKKLWDKRFGGPRHDFLNQVIQTSDGGYLLAGSSDSGIGGDKTQNSQGNRDYWVIRLDKNGNKLWDKRYGGSGYDELRQIKQLPSGGYLLAGYSNSPASGDKSQLSKGGMDYWIVQIDANGEKQWDKTYGGSADDYLQDVAFTSSLVPDTGYQPDGGLFLGGSSNSGLNGDKSQASRGGHDYWIIRVDSTGQKVWDKRYGGTGQDKFFAFGSNSLTSAGIRLAGNSDSPKSGDKSQPSKGGTDYWLVVIDAAGEIEESLGSIRGDYTYGGSGREELRSLSYVYDQDYLEDGFMLGGTSYSGKSGDKSQESQGGADYWVVRVDIYGRKLADQRLGGSESDELRAVVQTGENQFLLAGRSESGVSGDRTQPSQGQSDYWLIHTTIGTEPLATEKAAAVAARAETAIQRTALDTLATNFVAYPNPFREKATVRFSVETTQPVSLQVHDSQGRQVATLFQGQAQAKQPYTVVWQAKNQAAGLYFLRLQTAGKVQHQKVLLAK